MKKTILILLLLAISFKGYSQEEKKHRFTHTITENVGLFIDVKNSNFTCKLLGYKGYGLINLIPSYEIGYNNTYFARFKVRNIDFNHIEKNQYYIYADGDYLNNNSIYSHYTYFTNAYSLIFARNILNPQSKHILKLGLGLGCLSRGSRTEYDNKVSYHYSNSADLIVGLSYRYILNKHLGIGIESDWFIDNLDFDLNATLSYTF